MLKMTNIKLLGGSMLSAGGIEVIGTVADNQGDNLAQGVGIVTQIIILIATLYRLLKERKKY